MKETNQKPLYIVACPFFENGLFSIFLVCLSHILYAFKKGYIPIIDLQHYANQYFKDGREFKDNVWEYFFKQPAGFRLEDIDKNSNVIISGSKMEASCFNEINNGIKKALQGKDCEEFQEFFNKIEFSDEMKSFLSREYQEITKNENEILGIICRGTDYTSLRPDGHHIQPDSDILIKKAKELLKRFKYKKIYLATEDEKTYKKFQNEFKDMLIENKQYKYSYEKSDKNKLLRYIKVERKDHAYNLAKEYLLSIYILSRCRYLIGGITSALSGLWFMYEGFKNQIYTSFYDTGRYHNSNIIRGGRFLTPVLSIKNIIKEKFQKILYHKRTTGFNKY